MVDIQTEGHRTAFNRAFVDLGFECCSWSPHVYNDLLERGDGTAEGLIKGYFGTVGWPMMMATSDRGRFIERVEETKKVQLSKLLVKDLVPLRPDLMAVSAVCVAQCICVQGTDTLS